MNKLIRYFNQNRRRILLIVVIIAFILIIIQFLNGYIRSKDNTMYLNSNSNNISMNSNENNVSNVVKSDESLLSGEKIDNNSLNSNSDIIGDFINNCNNGELENAYNLISQECKDAIFPSIDDFDNLYYIPVFNNGKKDYTVENWNENIYRVSLVNNDYISTGKAEDGVPKVDYITIVNDSNKEKKLNINGFIERKDVDTESEKEKINIKVIGINQFMDYTEIEFDISNGSDNPILLDTLENPYTMYVEDENENKNSANTGELTQVGLKVNPSQEKNIKIKYYSNYSSSENELKDVVFSEIVSNYDEYNSMDEKSNYNNYYSISVEL